MLKMKDLVHKDNLRCGLTIALEGPDRVGKATQTKMLVAKMSNMTGWSKTQLIETPINDDFTHTRIYQLLRNGNAVKYPATFQGIQIANRLLFQQDQLPDLLETMDALVFDRWNASSYAYGRASGLSREELYCELDLVSMTDMTIILDGPPYPKENLDDYEKNLDFQNKVREYYLEWAKGLPKGHTVYVVDASDTIEAVHETIWEIVTNKIPTLIDNVVDMKKWKQEKNERK
jgi:thymidylate kinase